MASGGGGVEEFEWGPWRTWVYDKMDPRVRDWPTVGDPVYATVVLVGYLAFIYRIGPALMKHREPFDLRWAIRLHNAFMVVANAYYFVAFAVTAYRGGYNPLCQGMTYARDEASLRMVELCYWYLHVRTLDFLDTIFFVLRKKNDHVTFQHVSHHFCCVLSGLVWVAMGADGHTWFGLCFNTAIHVVMYAYYFLASFGPRMKPYLWWKRHLTAAQIVQHWLIMFHGVIPVFYDCGYPRMFIYMGLPQGLLGLALFINFYALSYTGKKSWSDIFSAAPCVLSDDNDPLRFQKLQQQAIDGSKHDDADDSSCYPAVKPLRRQDSLDDDSSGDKCKRE